MYFSFRYTVVSSLNPNDLESLYNRIAISIVSGEISSPRQVFEILRPAYVSDEKFFQDFCFFSISTRGQKKKLARYILLKLEIDALGRPDISEDDFSIEHILPEAATDEWRKFFANTQIEEMVYRIGNLTPLEPSLNRQVGNESFSIKKETYQQSRYALTQNILSEEWNADALASRQRQLAQRAKHIWRSDFSG